MVLRFSRVAQVQERLRKLGRLQFAKGQFAMGARSPIDPTNLKVLYGKTWPYMRNKYAYPEDDYPRYGVMQKQSYIPFERRNDPEKLNNVVEVLHHVCTEYGCYLKPWVQDAKLPCEPPACFKVSGGNSFNISHLDNATKGEGIGENLEEAQEEEKEVEEEEAKAHNGTSSDDAEGEDAEKGAEVHTVFVRHVTPVKVCSPLGCEQQNQTHQYASSLRSQMEYGQVHGVADPFGIGSLMDDDVQDAADVMKKRRTLAYNRMFSGEPLSDFLVRGWDGANSVPQVPIDGRVLEPGEKEGLQMG